MIYEEVVNFITPEYLNYLDNLNSQKYHQIKYYYDLNYPTFLRKDQDGEFHTVNYSASTVADIGEIPYDDERYLNQIFDVLAGQMPKNVVSEQRIAEAVLIVNDRNQLSDTMLNRLGFNLDLNELDTYNKQISFDELLNLNLKLAHSGVIYDKDEDSGIYLRRSNEDIYNDEKIITLKIVGILRRKQNASIPQYQGIRYTSGVNTFILNETKNSPIIREQQEIIDQHFQDGSPITSVLTGQQITENEAIVLLRKLGISQEPSRIVIFHINGEARQDIVNYLEAYNNDKVGDKRIFLDQSNISETWIVDGTLTSIKTVLIFVASIALFISISLLAILTYLSVIERTDEIGILRSIGARRKDIVRVFNAEAFIIGIFSGIFGLILTYSLLPVFNSIFEAALRVNQLIVIDAFLAGVLLLGNILLTLLIGIIPSLLASYKDPIDALKGLQ
jgi:putative ABC transport system permease protein